MFVGDTPRWGSNNKESCDPLRSSEKRFPLFINGIGSMPFCAHKHKQKTFLENNEEKIG